MEFEGTRTVETDKEHLWNLVSDPEVLVSSVPGAKEVKKIDETTYEGTIERGISRISIEMDGEVEITELNAPDSLSAEAIGEDQKTGSRMDATAAMEMEHQDASTTTLSYHVDMVFTGRLATLGARVVKRKINSDINEFFDNIQERAENGETVER